MNKVIDLDMGIHPVWCREKIVRLTSRCHATPLLVYSVRFSVVNRDFNPGIPNPGIQANFVNPEIPGLRTHIPGIFGIEKFHYYITKCHFMFCSNSATAIAKTACVYIHSS